MQLTDIEKERSIAIFNMIPLMERRGMREIDMDVAKAFARFLVECNVEATYWIVDREMFSITQIVQFSGKLIPTSETLNQLVEKHIQEKKDIKLVVAYGNEQDLDYLKSTVGQSCKIFFASDGDTITPQDSGPLRIIPGHILKELGDIRWWMITPRAILNTQPAPHPEEIPGGFVHEHDAYAQNGFTLSKEGKIDEALKSFRRAIELNPNCLRALGGASLSLLDIAELTFASSERDAILQEAEGMLQYCIKIDPSYKPPYTTLDLIHKARKGRTPEEVEAEIFRMIKEKQKFLFITGLSLEDSRFLQEYSSAQINSAGKEFLRRNGIDRLPKLRLEGFDDALVPKYLQPYRILGKKFGETPCISLYHFTQIFNEMALREPFYVARAFEEMAYREREPGRRLLVMEYAKSRGKSFFDELESRIQDQPRSVVVVNDLCIPGGAFQSVLCFKPDYAVAISIKCKKEEYAWRELREMELTRFYPILGNATEITFSAYRIEKPE